jgi:hypothetical protein
MVSSPACARRVKGLLRQESRPADDGVQWRPQFVGDVACVERTDADVAIARPAIGAGGSRLGVRRRLNCWLRRRQCLDPWKMTSPTSGRADREPP